MSKFTFRRRVIATLILVGWYLTCFSPLFAGQNEFAVFKRFTRGTGGNLDYQSSVLPLQFQKGVELDSMGSSPDKFGGTVPWFYRIHREQGLHYSAATGDWTINFQNPIAAFGSAAGGTPLVADRNYSFAVFAGINAKTSWGSEYMAYDDVIRISVYTKKSLSLGQTKVRPINQTTIAMRSLSENHFPDFGRDNYTKTVEFYGLTTTIKPVDVSTGPAFGINRKSPVIITHRASNTDYYYKVEMHGSVQFGMYEDINYPMVKVPDGLFWNPDQYGWSPLYTLNFDTKGPWETSVSDRPQFQGQPMPSEYYGKSLKELLAVQPEITVPIPAAPDAYLDVDNSPELRGNPILDKFVEDMGKDPLLLANYVLNDIDLVDPFGYPSDANIATYGISPPGIARNAASVFLEGQGSPLEQCALLVYLLRKSGTPATYVIPSRDGLTVLNSSVSNMLGIQLCGLDIVNGQSPEPQLIPVNYPWVAAFIDGKWVNVFPWLKDREMVEGYNVYDYLPEGYNSGVKWMLKYAKADPNITSLGDFNSSAAFLFQKFIRNSLEKTAPGMSIDDLGVKTRLRKNYYSNWELMPHPFSCSGDVVVKESYRYDPGIFDKLRVTALIGDSGICTDTLRICDVLNRQFVARTEKSGTNQYTFIISLSASRPGAENDQHFSEPDLIGKQTLVAPIPQDCDDIRVIIDLGRAWYLSPGGVYTATTQRDFDSPYGFWYSRFDNAVGNLKKGDLAAICLNVGKVTPKMMETQANEFLKVKRNIAGGSPSVSDVSFAQGQLAYLLGLQYYKYTSESGAVIASLHKIKVSSETDVGFAILRARRVDGELPDDGEIDLVTPVLNIITRSVCAIGNSTIHPNSGDSSLTGLDDFNMIRIVEDSCEEHRAINKFFNQMNAVSAVRLLQLSLQSTGEEPIYLSQTTSDPWSYIGDVDREFFDLIGQLLCCGVSSEDEIPLHYFGFFNCGLITPGAISNESGSYKGVGALIVGPFQQAALIGKNLNGGQGDPFPNGSLLLNNIPGVALVALSTDSDYSALLNDPNSLASVTMPPVYDPNDFAKIIQQLANGTTSPDPITSRNLDDVTRGLDLPVAPDSDQNAKNADAQSGLDKYGNLIKSTLNNLLDFVSDPVNVTSGEFYVDTVDLRLNGPMSLDLRRNYGSQVLGGGQFGYGWKINNMPYLTVAVSGTKIYAADDDGSVIAYTQCSGTQWVPTVGDNPQLCNFKDGRIGGLSNAFNSKIVRTTDGEQTYYTLTKADGSIQKFQMMTFTYPGVNGLVRNRPYLIRKTDNRGNYFDFAYGTDVSQPDFSQIRRIKASNGNFMGFYYDQYGHITQAYTGDGRWVYYGYDDYGDLTSVKLPDDSVTQYEYQHDVYPVNGDSVPYSLHLLTREVKPENNIIENTYDSLRRVTEQRSVVQSGTAVPVRSATFDYHWTSDADAPVAGYTTVTDAFSKTTRYDLADGRITLITDPLSQTVQQEWYATGDTSPGAYPRSLKRSVDKRGLVKEFSYDADGNLLTCKVTGDLTGDGNADVVTVTNTYISQNRLSTTVDDALGIQTNLYYDDTNYPFLVTRVEKSKGGVLISSSKSEYEAVVAAPLESSGLLKRLTRAPGTAEEAITDWTHNAKGLITSRTDYTGTSDPNVVQSLDYNLRNELREDMDALGRTIQYAYDGFGRRIWTEARDETGALVSWNYDYFDGNGNLTWSDGPRYNPEDYVWNKYDGASRKTEEVHWRSRAKSDGSGVEAEIGDNLYASTLYSYDRFGNLRDVADPLRNVVHMDYDDIGQMRERKAYQGNPQTGRVLASESFEYEPGGQVSVYTSPLAAVTRKYYTSTGLLKRQENPDNSVLEWRYDLGGRPVKQRLSNNSYRQTVYDEVNRTVTSSLVSGSGVILATTMEQRDRRGNVTSTQNAEGFVFQTTYDGLDRVKTVTGPAADVTSGQQITTNIYDNCGQVFAVVNARNEKTTTVYDVLKRPLSVQVLNASGGVVSQTSYSYSADKQSFTTTVGSGTGAISTTTYTDVGGAPMLTKYADGTFTRSIYDSKGNRTSVTDELQRTTRFSYNGLNRLETSTLPDDATTTYYYDPAGNLTQRVMPGNLVWSGTYDGLGRRTGEWLQDGNQVTRQFGYTYYASGPYIGLPQNTTDSRNVTSTATYDDFLRVATLNYTGPLPEQNVSLSYLYDKRSLLKQIAQSSTANANGPPTRVERDYDSYSKIIDERVFVDGVIQSDLAQKWDNAGRRENLGLGTLIAAQGNGAGSSIGFGHQANGQLNSVTTNGQTFNFSYGDNGLLTSRQNPWRTVTVDHRDARGRLLQETQTAGGEQPLQEILAWQVDGRLSGYTANRQGASAWNENVGYGYNSRNQLTREGYSASAGSTATLGYEFDFGSRGGLGVLTQKVSNGLWSSRLDTPGSFGRAGQESTSTAAINWTASGTALGAALLDLAMDGAPVSGVGLDTANGNWIAALILSPGRHQLVATGYNADRTKANSATSNFTVSGTSAALTGSSATITPEYDPVGNMISRTFSDGRVQTLKWDALGRLITVTQRDTANNGYNWSAIYDGLGRRLGTTYTPVVGNAPNIAAAQTILSYYDPQVEFLEIAVSVNGDRTWKLHGPDRNGAYGGLQGIGGLETTIHESDGATVAFLNDTFGNIVATVSGTSLLWQSTKAGSYGPLPGSNPEYLSATTSVAQTMSWRGKRLDETGFYYLGARYYEPNSGRFLSPDPLGHAASMSLYDYCNGDPVNGLDPDGRCAGTAWKVAKDVFQATADAETRKATAEMNAYIAARDFYGDDAAVANARYNPIFPIVSKAGQAYDGMGYEPQNAGQPLSPGDRFICGAEAFVQTAAIIAGLTMASKIGKGAVAGDAVAGEIVAKPFIENPVMIDVGTADAVVTESSAADSGLLAKYLNGSGGRWGGTATRLQNDALATSLEDASYEIMGGAGRASEQWIPGPNGGIKGGTWVDITAKDAQGNFVRVQTVTTDANGIPIQSELDAAARIRQNFPNDPLILIPKWPK